MRLTVPPHVIFSFAILGMFVATALLAPYIAPYEPNSQSLLRRLKPPSYAADTAGANLLGTDQLGRDVLSRSIFALRTSLGIAAIGTLVGLFIGTALGVLSGMIGGWLDNVLMMLVDVQVSIPFILLALTVVAVFGTSIVVLIVVVCFAGWETYARLARGQVLATKHLPFVEASAALGAGLWRQARSHVIPNISSPLIVLATLNFSAIILLESALSFLGLGVQPPTASLGSMVGSGREHMLTAPWLVAVPGVCIFLLTMTTSLIGDWLRDVLDSRTHNP